MLSSPYTDTHLKIPLNRQCPVLQGMLNMTTDKPDGKTLVPC
jgi:hypothetical protein